MNQTVIQRLRETKRQAEALQAESEAEQKHQAEQGYAHGFSAGVAWAEGKAMADQLQTLENQTEREDDRGHLIIDGIHKDVCGKQAGWDHRRGFVEGALKVWREVKEQL
jgi:hypothetical protein